MGSYPSTPVCLRNNYYVSCLAMDRLAVSLEARFCLLFLREPDRRRWLGHYFRPQLGYGCLEWVIFYLYERRASLPQPIVLLILFRGADPKFDTSIPSPGNPKPIHTDRLSFFSLCLGALCWGPPCLLSSQDAEVEDIPYDIHWPSPLFRHDLFDGRWTGF